MQALVGEIASSQSPKDWPQPGSHGDDAHNFFSSCLSRGNRRRRSAFLRVLVEIGSDASDKIHPLKAASALADRERLAALDPQRRIRSHPQEAREIAR